MSLNGWLRSFLAGSVIAAAGGAGATVSFLPTFPGVMQANFSSAEGGVNETQFNEVIDHFLEVYRPESERSGLSLAVQRRWESEVVNATARLDGKKILITVYGGLARAPELTVDGLALVLCHEAGHFLGGAPKVDPQASAGSSFYGQAEYYTTLKCLRRVFAGDDNEEVVGKLTVEPVVARRCARQFSRRADELICVRSSVAALSTAHAISLIAKTETRPSLLTPDRSEVEKTIRTAPGLQCRLDTWFAGALCAVDVNVSVSDQDESKGTCNEVDDLFGARPRCWYKPVEPPPRGR